MSWHTIALIGGPADKQSFAVERLEICFNLESAYLLIAGEPRSLMRVTHRYRQSRHDPLEYVYDAPIAHVPEKPALG